MQTIFEAGIRLILLLQSLGDWLTGPMKFFTALGNEEFYLLIAPILFWCIDARLGLRMGLLLMISGGLNDVLKVLTHQPRPYWIDTRVRALSSETSLGIPSGHSQNAAAVWGILAARLKGWGAWAAGIGVIFLIGLSRVYLGVHFPSDVLAGWLIGALILLAFLRLEAPIQSWLASLSLSGKLLAALAGSMGLILLGILARLSLGSWTVPVEWVQNASAATGLPDPIHPLASSGMVANAGVLLGLSAGAILVSLEGGFDTGGPIWKRALRFLIGLAGVLIVWRGLGAILPTGEDPLALAFRYLRYTLIGVWVTGLAPLLFLRMKLADKLRIDRGSER